MRIKVKTIFDAKASLEKLAQTIIPAKAAIKLARLLRSLNVEYKTAEEQRVLLIQKHGEEVEDQPGQFQISKEKQQLFFSELEDLFSVEINIDAEPILLSDLGDSFEITASDLIMLEDFILGVDE